MNNKNIVTLFIICLFILAGPVIVKAQILPPPPPDSSVPLDPLSWVILGAGGVAAGKKYLDNKKKNKDNNDTI